MQTVFRFANSAVTYFRYFAIVTGPFGLIRFQFELLDLLLGLLNPLNDTLL